jgi:2-C-methyl-D-erythritol 4-phosphate cytidylyltransferase
MARHPAIARVFVVLAPDDGHFRRRDWSEYGPNVAPLYCGGATRAASVLNGLLAARDEIGARDWVLVHDAVRPCLARSELDRLFAEIGDDETGGLLALPVADTVKRADRDSRVLRTEPRDSLWLAQTPQMFRYRVLLEALRGADPAAVTDEASAIERLGLKPRLVTGSARNIKVTYPEDLVLAEQILRSYEP